MCVCVYVRECVCGHNGYSAAETLARDHQIKSGCVCFSRPFCPRVHEAPPPPHEYGNCVSPANGQDKGLRVNKLSIITVAD